MKKSKRDYFDISNGKGTFVSNDNWHWAWDMRFPVFPTRFTDAKRVDGKYLRHINYPNIAVELILEGEALYIDGETTHRAVTGSVFLIVPHSNVKMINANPGTSRRKLVIIGNGSAPGMMCNILGFDGDKLIQPDDPQDIEKRMRQIGEIIKNKRDHREAALLFYDLLLTLSFTYNSKQKMTTPGMQQLKKYIIENLNGNLSAEKLSGFAGISESTLRRQVQKHYGCSPLELVNTLRLEQAEMLLRTTDQAIKEIAIACGFHSPVYFGTLFKAKFGTTPGEYRKKRQSPDEHA